MKLTASSEVHLHILEELKAQRSSSKALILSRFFKTAKGEYGEGDMFLGVTVPAQRVIVKQYAEIANKDTIQHLLNSPIHEARLTGVLLLQACFERALKKEKTLEKPHLSYEIPAQWVALYLENTHRINNWDLVDTSAPGVLGKWLEDKDRSILYQLASGQLLWENRIAMVATLHFIRNKETEDVLKLSKLFLSHPHDLMHKATGWMLREAWKRNPGPIEKFLQIHKLQMPRTMLRYAIEKMPKSQRRILMAK